MLRIFLLCLSLLLAGNAWAGEVNVAVAANFAVPFAKIAKAYSKVTGNRVIVSIGSTGKLYAQIKNGAPFEIFLAADTRRPKMLVADGLAVAGSERTYAIGRLVLWSPRFDVSDGATSLRIDGIRHIAIANPKTAPYGVAVIQVLDRLKLSASVQPKLVEAENIAQAFQFIASGNADAGFVALSQLKGLKAKSGSSWIVPANLYKPIDQALCMLKSGVANPTARSLAAFLKSKQANAIISDFGYEIPKP